MATLDNPILMANKSINPYRFAASMLIDRIKWDFSGFAKDSRRKLHNYRDKYINKKAIIICNGPSLNKVDLSLLKDTYAFGLNKIDLIFNRTEFRPSFIVSVNSHVISQNCDFYNTTDIPLFIDSKSCKIVNKRSNVTFLHSVPVKTFARDCSISINQGGTVTFVALQLAFHMGFSQVGLIGCDHYFKDKGLSNSLVASAKEDENHFDKNYFSNGQLWQLPDLPQSEYSYHMANDFYNANGRKIYNCTDGGYLEIFERMSLSDFLNC